MTMTIVKAIVSLAIIFGATYVGKKMPTLAGLIGVMPLTGLLVLVWLCIENPDSKDIMLGYSRGAFWGVLPSLAFFATLFACVKLGLPIWGSILAAMAVWILGAVIHQYLLG